MSRKSTFVLAALLGALLGHAPGFGQELGRLEVVVREKGQPIPCRAVMEGTPSGTEWPEDVVAGRRGEVREHLRLAGEGRRSASDKETAADTLAATVAAGRIVQGHQRVGECRGSQGVGTAAETVATRFRDLIHLFQRGAQDSCLCELAERAIIAPLLGIGRCDDPVWVDDDRSQKRRPARGRDALGGIRRSFADMTEHRRRQNVGSGLRSLQGSRFPRQ